MHLGLLEMWIRETVNGFGYRMERATYLDKDVAV